MSDIPRTDSDIWVTDTPRTDSLIWDRNKYEGPLESYSEFCRELERELNEANQRIKRLIEAGDEMAETTTTPAAEAWIKAKGEK